MSGKEGAAVTGARWLVIAQASSAVAPLVMIVVLARLLDASEFGLAAVASAIAAFLMLANDLGIGAGIIYHSDESAGFRASAFWANVALGVALALAFALLAPATAALFGEPRLVPILKVLALAFVINGLLTTHNALMERALRFRELGLIQIAAAWLGTFFAIGAAFAGLGAIAIVSRWLVQSFVTLVGVWACLRYLPSFKFSFSSLRPVVRYSLNLTSFKVINWFARKSDDVIITRVLGAEALGPYSLAYRIMLLPLENLSSVMSRLLFPLLSGRQRDLSASRRAYLRTVRAVATLSFPLMAGLVVVADSFVGLLLGPQWAEVPLILRILAPVGALQSIVSLCGPVILSQGRSGLQFRLGLLNAAVMLLAFLIGVSWGVVGVAAFYAAANALVALPVQRAVLRLLGIEPRAFLACLLPQLAATAAMLALIWPWHALLLAAEAPQALLLLSSILLGGLVYFLAILALDRAHLGELMEVTGLRQVPLLSKVLTAILEGRARV